MTFTLAIIGRPNVGKSTLFNRLVGKKLAIVDDVAGTTRDRRYAPASLAGLDFTIIDTAGLEEAPADALETRMMEQTKSAITEADVILLMVDVRDGVTTADEVFARMVRASNKPVILVGNKAEGKAAAAGISDLYSLGFSKIALISAEHGEGMGELYEALEEYRAEADVFEEDESTEEYEHLSIAIIGRPNAGKSTLINALLGDERLLVGPEAGITRDSISVEFAHKGRSLKLVDTAGMRKRSNIQHKLEKLAVADSVRAIKYAQVVVVLLDATAPLEKQDAVIASLVEREGRACIIGLNKWDLVTAKKKEYLEELRYMLDKQLPQFHGIEAVPCSALNRKGLDDLMDACMSAYDIWNKRVPTAELNRWLEMSLQHHSPPMVRGRRLKVKYMTQIKSRPPAFQISTNMKKEFPDAYLRYLVNGLRESFGLKGTPIRMNLKVSNNPFAKNKKK
ncbi:MAG: ribosome biogenesis GTPase Der [Rickettsiales bacterium]